MLFRRSGGAFFGKILKVCPTVTTRLLAKLPGFRHRAPLVAACMAVMMATTATPWLTDRTSRADQPPPASVYSKRTPSVAEGATEQGADAAADTVINEDAAAQAERIVASSFAIFPRASSVSARLRQKARVGDRVLVGTGRYLQAGRGEEQRFRFDSTLTCDTETFELTEVCDGLFCWTHRHNGDEPPSLQRVDVQRVRARLAELKSPHAADGTAYLGGLQHTLRMLRHWFRFSKATPGTLDGTPVWLVDGAWLPMYLAILMPDLKERVEQGTITPADLPDGMPWSVRLAIGRGDLILRQIEWLAIPGSRPVADGPLEPIAVLELHDVEIDGAVDTTAFFYQPASDGLIDVTEMQVNGLQVTR